MSLFLSVKLLKFPFLVILIVEDFLNKLNIISKFTGLVEKCQPFLNYISHMLGLEFPQMVLEKMILNFLNAE
jgi:hypothetical protein